MKLKVLMVGNDPSVKGGITSVISQLMSHDWAADGIEMAFIPTYIEANPLKKIAFFADSYIKIRHCVRVWKPDVVHIHMSYRGSFTRKLVVHKLCRKYGVPDIIHLHGSEFAKWYWESDKNKQERVRRLLRECNAFVVLGKQWNEAIKKIEPETKTLVVSNTIAIPKQTAKWNNQPFRVLFLGVLIQRKGVADLLQAVKKIKDSGSSQNMLFTIAGSGSEEDQLKKLSNELGITDIVEFVGWTDGEKKKELLLDSQLLVLPSYNEGLPIAILEGISYGLPVVATDVGDVSAAVHDGKNGFLIKPGDISTLADSICKISSDKARFETMSLYSRKLAENKFSDVKYFEALRGCYESVGERK